MKGVNGMAESKRKTEAHLAAEKRILELEKQLKSAESREKWFSEKATKVEEQLEQLHAVFDSIPGFPPRTFKREGYSSEYEMLLSNRFIVWLASK